MSPRKAKMDKRLLTQEATPVGWNLSPTQPVGCMEVWACTGLRIKYSSV